MIVVMKPGATGAQVTAVVARIERQGCQAHVLEGIEPALSGAEGRTIVGAIGDGRLLERETVERMEGVERTVPILRPFRLAGRDLRPQDTVVTVNGVPIGGRQVIVMAGPCAVESRDRWELVEPVARAAVAAGADGLLVEVHPHPAEAPSDGAQALTPERFAALMESLRAVTGAVGRSM